MRPMRRVLFLSAGIALSGACGEDTEAEPAALVVADGCQPLLATTIPDELSQAPCILPYPSEFHRDGARITLRGAAKPRRISGAIVDPNDAYVADGSSTIPMLVATLPSRLLRGGLPGITSDP